MTRYVIMHKSERKDQMDDGFRDGKTGRPAQPGHRAYLIKKGEIES
jgi:hypothetical protein